MNINILEVFRPGDNIELHYINNKNEDINLSTTVYDIISEDEMLIFNPTFNGKLYSISMNMEVIITSKRSDYGVLAVDVLLLKRMKLDNIYAIKCKIVSDITRQQRREYFRVKLLKEIKIVYLVDEFQNSVKEYVFDFDTVADIEVSLNAKILDLSGGGIGLRVKKCIELNTFVYIDLSVLDIPIKIYGIVVRCLPSKRHTNEYEIGLEFKNLKSEISKKITSFVLLRQQKIRKRGKY